MGLSTKTNIIILSAVFSVLAVFAVLLRFWARSIQRAGFSIDDWMIVPGLLFAIGLCVNNIIAAAIGNAGGHIHVDEQGAVIFDRTLTIFLQTEYATQLLSVLSLVFTKVSIVLFYRRVFRGKTFSIVSIILLGAICAWGIAFFFATLFECMPIAQAWKSMYGTPEHVRYCYDYLPMFIATAISNMSIDILILAVPLPMVWRLKMPTRQKVGVSGFFLMGAFVVGISIARIYFFYQSSAGYANAQDITYNIAPTLYWTELEATIAVISACLPTMRPLFVNFSVELLFKEYTSKISLFSGSKTGYFGKNSSNGEHAEPRWNQRSARGSASSLREIVNTCEAVPMSTLEDDSDYAERKPGIVVQKTIRQSND